MRAVGPDVSHLHPVSDWARLLDTGASLVGIKVSQGASFVDPWLARHLQGARDADGRLAAVLLYHFLERDVDPVRQAERFAGLVGSPGPREILCVDVEERHAPGGVVVPPPDLPMVEAFVAALPAGRKVAYTSDRVWRLIGSPGWPRANLGGIGLWAPRYDNSTAEPPVPGPWGRWDFWQYSEAEAFPGVDGPCDGNYFRGTEAELHAWMVGLPTNPDGSVSA